jgi:hypothetical protein
MKMIPLTQGKFAKVDDRDYDFLMQWKWCATKGRKSFYAVRTETPNITVIMHRLIADAPKGKEVDHINHDGLDNRRENLRVCTHSENMRNQRKPAGRSSKYRGVSKQGNKWRVELKIDNKRAYKESFHGEIDAARAYDAKARELYGEFAILNFPD